jgi:hypothetical protein
VLGFSAPTKHARHGLATLLWGRDYDWLAGECVLQRFPVDLIHLVVMRGHALTEVHHTVVWMKFKATRKGADVATRKLWKN